ncbi:MAG: lipopolysaccharide biosynthesis protein [Deltaproteobacteria bacterium]|nr:lipopolysaccharide biosynthesis protein [Deltaproteobacteria bacterium]
MRARPGGESEADGGAPASGSLAALARRGAWAVADQAVFAGTQFVVTALAARWMAAEAFGAFATTYAVFLLAATFHTALLSEPALVVGAAGAAADRPRYLTVLAWLHLRISVALVAALALAALALAALGVTALAGPLAMLALSAPAMLLLWLMRRACLLEATSRLAVAGGLLYLVVLVGLVAALRVGGRLGAATLVAAHGVAGLAVGLAMARALGIRRPASASEAERRRVLAEHWAYARWSLPTSALTWVPANVPYVVLPIAAGWDASGALRAVTTVFMPFVLANQALGQMLVPVLARATPEAAARLSRRTAALLTLVSTAGWLACALGGEAVIAALFGARYAGQGRLLWILGLLPVLNGPTGVMLSHLRARGRAEAVFWAYLAGAACAVTAGVAATARWLLDGAALAIIGAYLVLLAATALQVRRGVGNRSPGPA